MTDDYMGNALDYLHGYTDAFNGIQPTRDTEKYREGYEAGAGKARAYDEGPYADGYAHAQSQRIDEQCRLPAGPGEDDDCEACQ